jgi:thiamine biosynthesis lipoprotein
MKLTRRQLLISAGATGVVGCLGAGITSRGSKPVFRWRGSAMGGEARIVLYGVDRDTAKAAMTAAAQEIERLEMIFSLHRAGSELSRLNSKGILLAPSRDLVDVLRAAQDWRRRTEGAFDPTVQPLWQAAAKNADLKAAMSTVGNKIDVSSTQVTLPAGAALTLNGIAQGTIADRVTEILHRYGLDDVVINAGELRLPGRTRRPIGIPSAKAVVDVAEVAIATSEPRALIFDQSADRHHLFDPRTGESPNYWKSLSVFAPTAEMADALSTAFAVSLVDAVADFTSTIGDIAVIGADYTGRIYRFGTLPIAGAATVP